LELQNLPPTQIQAIGYPNIFNDLQLALGLSISLVVHKTCQNQTVSNYYGANMLFAVAPSILGVTTLPPTPTQAIGYPNIP